jgi:shikimate dehydrogenase
MGKTVCISIALHPGSFGKTVHNAAYTALGLDFVYAPMGVVEGEGNLEAVLDLVRRGGIRGCSVSMPYKDKVIPLLDEVDSMAARIGAVNTIVNSDGRLVGYNTDYLGVLEALPDLTGREVLMVGAGGVASAIAHAVIEKGGNLTITNRSFVRAKGLAQKVGALTVEWNDRLGISGYMLINATSVGMNSDETPWPMAKLAQFEVVYDVPTSPIETRFVREARSSGLEAIPGYVMCLGQAVAQFKLYTGHEAPREAMRQAMLDYIGNKK